MLDISRVFENDFILYETNHDQDEVAGAPYLKTGWFRMDGNVANSRATSIPDPAFLAVMIEKVGGYGAADLPFITGEQFNGDLLARGQQGDVID